ncbi:MAG: SDR family NAD(P)-dependent oxidoreductase, partial [Desulfobacteraceae bacterium]|nr:SDR family NAD(P)-dependent oxidoreductase [Desulfobacteraceae bacterium]
GLDSILIARFNRKMESALGPLPRTLLFEHRNLRDLAGYLVQHHEQKLTDFFGMSMEAPESMPTRQRLKASARPRSKTRSGSTAGENDIAVIGVGGRYPHSRNLLEVWQNLASGVDCIDEIPPARWDWSDVYDPDPKNAPAGKMYCKWGGFLEDADQFDPLFFNISPREAEIMDPQERLFLETAWETLEDAGYAPQRLNRIGHPVGVFVGVTSNTYQFLDSGSPGRMPTSQHWSVANRVSYAFDFSGPSLPVDTACSASLHAIHLACESLAKGECGFALAGGVNLYLHPSKYIQLCQTRMLSPTGRCHSFGAGGDGFVPGEGVGAVLLTPLSHAMERRDRIYAVIKGSAVNHGGKTNGYTVPNPNAQAALIETALNRAGIDPRTISYIEAHGTGTTLGDPVEIRGLTTAFRKYTDDCRYCAVGSVKSNIGHLESAAGIAGLTKILLQMTYGQLVPSLHAQELNPNIRFQETPFYVQQERSEWKSSGSIPRRAGLSSFGAGGSNAHIIVEAFDDERVSGGRFGGGARQGGQGPEGGGQKAEGTAHEDPIPQLIVLSAKNEERLRAYAKRLAEFIRSNQNAGPSPLDLSDIAYTLQSGREAMEERLALVASGIEELQETLSKFSEGSCDANVVCHGNIRTVKTSGNLPMDGNAGDAYLQVVYAEKDVRKMARLWVSGVAIDWNRLHDGSPFRTISLPTYPFAKERYWVSPSDDPAVFESRTESSEGSADFFFMPRWQPRPLEKTASRATSPGKEKKTVLVVCPQDAVALSAALSSLHPEDEILEIRLGKENRRISEDIREIDARDPLSMEECMAEADRIDHVYFLGGIAPKPWAVTSMDDLERSQEYGVMALFRMITSMIRNDRIQHGQRWTVITNDIHPVLPDDRVRPFAGSLLGLAKAIAREHKQIIVSCIDIRLAGVSASDPDGYRSLLEPVLREPGQTDRIDEIAIRNNHRYVRVVEPVALPAVTDTPFREKGVYFILGGAGGIGSALSRYLSKNFKARLALIGRRPLDEKLQNRLDRIEALGGRVLYLQADAADSDSMRAAVQRARSRFGRINGAIHSALVLKDKTLLNMDEDTFRSVLAPKVQGSVVLYEAVRREPLDFLLFFSSAQSHIVNAGQSNYAAACTFKDAFALHLSRKMEFPVRIVNWGYWGSIGVASSEDYNRRLSALGIGSIEPEEGMEAIRRILAHPFPQVMPFKATQRFLTDVGIRGPGRGAEKEAAAGSKTRGPAPVRPVSTRSIMEEIVTQGLRNALGLKEEHIDRKKPFAEYGVDSVMAIELVNGIGNYIQVPLKTTILFDYANVDDLSRYLNEQYGEKTASLFSEPPAARAISAVSEEPAPSAGMEEGDTHVAVIGMAGCFPGAKDLNAFWRNLAEGRDCVTEAPKERWDSDRYYDPDPSRTDKTYCKWGGFLTDIDRFDPMFFNLSGKEAEQTDPQQRLFLEACWSALEDAGYSSRAVSDIRCGVFAGTAPGDYDTLLETPSLLGNSPSILVSRISYLLNLKGPSVSVDTACSSSLVAVHMGCQSIRTGESDMVLAGGVCIRATPAFHIVTSNGGMLSPTGRCRTFDDAADGFVPGEGVGVVVLKPLARAVADGDHIYGVIKGSGINQDGKTNGITAPSGKAQTDLELSVYHRSGIRPDSISYVEAHGTGTKLGDPVEIEALTRAFGRYSDRARHCPIGSVKTNIGHAIYAAGIAGLIKVLLALRHRQLPPSLHFDRPNRHIDFDASPFTVITRLADWAPAPDAPRRAAVSSFGYSGTNAHMVVEEFDDHGIGGQESETRGSEPTVAPQLIVLSARSEVRLAAYANRLAEFLKIGNRQSKITNIAYTHQVGRDAMEHRMALVASSLGELREKLEIFVSGGTDIQGLYRGRVREDSEGAPRPPVEREGKPDLHETARRWVSGAVFDWKRLHTGYHPVRTPLPTYPFERERYWAPEAAHPDPVSALHPLIDANVSTLEGQCFRKTISRDAFYSRDHVVGGMSVLPGAVYLEMARAAGVLSTGNGPVRRLHDVVWVSPIQVDDAKKRIDIRLWPADRGVEFEIRTGRAEPDRNEERIVHCRGHLGFDDPGPGSEPPEAPELVRKRLTHRQDSRSFYRMFESFGFAYGPAFRTVTEIFHNGREALARLALPESLRSTDDGFVLHPSLMDGALQTVTGIMGNRTEKRVCLPYAMGELSFKKRLSDRCWVHAVRKETSGNAGVEKFDIQVLDPSGVLLAKIRDFSVRAVEPQRDRGIGEADPVYFRLEWQPASYPEETSPSDAGPVLLLDRDASRRKELAERLDAEILLVLPGKRFEAQDPATLVLDPKNPEHYRNMISRLVSEDRLPRRIVHFWSQSRFHAEPGRVKEQVETGLFSLLFLARALMTQRVTTPLKLLYLHTETVDSPQPAHAAVSGFAKTLRLENPNLVCKTVAVEDAAGDLPHIVQREFFATDAMAVRYEAGQRFTRVLEPHEPAGPMAPFGYIRDRGVYLITGGAGGIGRLLAERLSRLGNVRLVLTGRRPSGPEIEALAHRLARAGTEVRYIRADLSQPGEARELVSRVVSRYGGIHGIFHAAGVLLDGLIYGKREEDVTAVLGPKVWGTLHLDDAVRSEDLDFWVLFSSVTAVTGNTGQSDYAYANAFMDRFADWRNRMQRRGKRHGKTLSVNWPLWAGGGMDVDDASRRRLRDEMGMVPLHPEKGWQALHVCMDTDHGLVVFGGDPEKFASVWAHSEKPHFPPPVPRGPVADPAETSLREPTEAFLKTFLAAEVQLPAAKIGTRDPFERFGIDSVMVMNLTRKLERKFGELSKTLFFEYRNIAELAAYFAEHHPAVLQAEFGEPGPAHEPDVGTMHTEPARDRTTAWVRTPRPVPDADTSDASAAIAVIGLSGRYPQAGDLETFWENLHSGRDCITEIPADRWDYRPWFDPDRAGIQEGKIYTKWGGFLDDVDKFDALFFHISPKEAKLMDPQERLFLETAWHTLEDAGYTRAALAGRPVGVFVGVMWGEYQLIGAEETMKGNRVAPRSSFASISNRVSYLFDFTGPSITLDTMCSSSLTAVHLACDSIRKGDSALAVAGGVNLSLHRQKYLQLSQGGFASSDGRCRSFGDGGDGYVPGEGVGAVLLKPLDAAVRDGDHIYGVIRGTAVNHGGKTNGYTVPNPNAQAELIARTIRSADIDPRTITCLEAHGTGTALGDPIEITGLMKAFGKGVSGKQFCAIGSVKSNIGHLESAAGIAGLTKVLLQMKHRKLLPSLHSRQLNPNIRFEATPFYVPQEPEAWKQPTLERKGIRQTLPRRAGISSFGAGGANAHLIVEEFQESDSRNRSSKSNVEPQLVVLSAKNEDRLKAYAEKFVRFLAATTTPEGFPHLLADLAFTLQAGREAMEHRLAVIADSMEDFREKLSGYVSGKEEFQDVIHGSTKAGSDPVDGVLEGEEGRRFIASLMEDRKLHQLARLWVSGVFMDWRPLHAARRPKRLSLPVYPFARERFWVSVLPTAGLHKTIPLHPFVDGIDLKKSTRQGIIFKKRFLKSDRILQDHQVNGTAILPGVAIAEMIRAAGSMILEGAPVRLSRLVWLRPVVVNDRFEDIEVVFTNREAHYTCRVQTRNHDDAVIHATAELRPASDADSTTPVIPLEAIKERCSRELSAEDLYSLYRGYGIDYGSYLRGVRHLWGNDREALAHVRLPEPFRAEPDAYALHPTLADAALQTVAGITDVSDTGSRSILLPYAVEGVEIFKPVSSDGYAYVTQSAPRQFDVRLADSEGNVCVVFRDLAIKAVQDFGSGFFYVPGWRHVPLDTGSAPAAPPNETRKVLIIHPTLCFGLERGLAALHGSDEVYFIRLGTETRRHSERSWEVRVGDPDALATVIQEPGPMHWIYFLGGILPPGADAEDLDRLAESQEIGVRSLFRCLKGMTEHSLMQFKPKLAVVTNDVFRIGSGDVATPSSGGLCGFAKAVDREFRDLSVRYLDISLTGLTRDPEPEALTRIVSSVFREMAMDQPALDTAERNGRRYL